MESLQNAIKEIEPLAKGPIHLPLKHSRDRVFPAVATTMTVATIIYLVSYILAKKIFAVSKTTSDSDRKSQFAARRRLCYQITNMSTNLFLSLMGCYFEYYLLPENPTMAEKVQGQEDYYVFAAVQIGYQLWSLIVGTIFVEERIEMIFHHIAVICVASMSAFFTNGFRFWTPYFFGIFELSSVPLGLMNCMKDNKIWMKKYPAMFAKVRLVFATAFLTVRIGMLIPRLIYLRDCFLVPYLMDSEHLGYRVYLLTVWASSCFLFSLQLYWGYLIASGIVKAIMGGGKVNVDKAIEKTQKAIEKTQ